MSALVARVSRPTSGRGNALPATGAGLDIYDEALTAQTAALRAHWSDGSSAELPIHEWLGPTTSADDGVLGRAAPPVLDVGCGPGRHLAELARRQVDACGVDLSTAAVRIARRRGARALTASIFDPLPWPGPWNTVLLLDGNVGIGGDPVALLGRVRSLLAAGGHVLVELAAPGAPSGPGTVCLEADRRRSTPFRWARASVDHIESISAAAGLRPQEIWSCEKRWFAALASC